MGLFTFKQKFTSQIFCSFLNFYFKLYKQQRCFIFQVEEKVVFEK
jgi:hypothetical protein